MRTVLSILVCVALLLAASASAQQLQLIIFGNPPATVTYTGPGDITTFTAWGSCTRAYNHTVASAGHPACNLRRVSDNATCTVSLAANGGVDISVGTPCNGNTQTVTAWIGASSATVSKVYDQVQGNACNNGLATCDMVQGTNSNQPDFILTGCGASGTLPCLSETTSGSTKKLAAATNMAGAVTFSISMVGFVSSTSFDRFGSINGNNNFMNASAGNYIVVGSNNQSTDPSATAADNAWHAAQGIGNSGSGTGSIKIDSNSPVTGTATGNTSLGILAIMQAANSSITMRMGEFGFVNGTAWSSGVQNSLHSNQATYYGTP